MQRRRTLVHKQDDNNGVLPLKSVFSNGDKSEQFKSLAKLGGKKLQAGWKIIAGLVVGLPLIYYLAAPIISSSYRRILLHSTKTNIMSRSLCTINPYIPSFNTSLGDIALQAQNWLDHMDEHLLEARKPEYLKDTHDRFFPFRPLSSCNDVTCIGGRCTHDDTSKVMCGLERLTTKTPSKDCVVYSIGGNNRWNFELDILGRTPCQVHSFDCTGSKSRFAVPYHDRLTFHHICLGAESHPAPKEICTDTTGTKRSSLCGPIMTFNDIRTKLGHDRIELMKFDIEGYEWPIFYSWPELLLPTSDASIAYPMQILVEIHYKTHFRDLWLPNQENMKQDFRSPEDLVMLNAHFLKMGYAVIIRDDNEVCDWCTELTLVRFQC